MYEVEEVIKARKDWRLVRELKGVEGHRQLRRAGSDHSAKQVLEVSAATLLRHKKDFYKGSLLVCYLMYRIGMRVRCAAKRPSLCKRNWRLPNSCCSEGSNKPDSGRLQVVEKL